MKPSYRLPRPSISVVPATRSGKVEHIAAWRDRVVELVPRRPDTELTVGDVLSAYRDQLYADDKPSAKELDGLIELWIRPAFGEVPLADLRAADVEAWVRTLIDARLEANTVITRAAVLAAALELPRADGLIEKNPARLRRGVLPARRHRPGFDPAKEVLSAHESERLLFGCASIPEDRRALYALLNLSGMRFGEVVALRWADVDFAALPLGRITVSRSWSRKNARLQRPKSGKGRDIPLYPTLAHVLVELRDHVWPRWIGRKPEATDLIVPYNSPVHGLTYRVDRQSLRRFHADLRRAGLARRRLHSLRHTFVSQLLSAGANWRAVQHMTHPTPRWSAFDSYAHLSWSALCDAVLHLNVRFASSKQLELFPEA